MSDLNITIKVFDRGTPNQIDSADKFLIEYRNDLGELQGRSKILSLQEFNEYREDRFSALSQADRDLLLKESRIYPRASVTWFRSAAENTQPKSPKPSGKASNASKELPWLFELLTPGRIHGSLSGWSRALEIFAGGSNTREELSGSNSNVRIFTLPNIGAYERRNTKYIYQQMAEAIEKALPSALETAVHEVNQTVGGQMGQAAIIAGKKAENKGSWESLFGVLLKPLSSASNDSDKIQQRHDEIRQWIKEARSENPDPKVLEKLDTLLDRKAFACMSGGYQSNNSVAKSWVDAYVSACIQNALRGNPPPTPSPTCVEINSLF